MLHEIINPQSPTFLTFQVLSLPFRNHLVHPRYQPLLNRQTIVLVLARWTNPCPLGRVSGRAGFVGILWWREDVFIPTQIKVSCHGAGLAD